MRGSPALGDAFAFDAFSGVMAGGESFAETEPFFEVTAFGGTTFEGATFEGATFEGATFASFGDDGAVAGLAVAGLAVTDFWAAGLAVAGLAVAGLAVTALAVAALAVTALAVTDFWAAAFAGDTFPGDAFVGPILPWAGFADVLFTAGLGGAGFVSDGLATAWTPFFVVGTATPDGAFEAATTLDDAPPEPALAAFGTFIAPFDVHLSDDRPLGLTHGPHFVSRRSAD